MPKVWKGTPIFTNHIRRGSPPCTALPTIIDFCYDLQLPRRAIMKILALIESADHVCYRYRFNALAWALAQEGLLLEALPIQKGLGRISTLLAGSRAEIVILQRKLLPAWQLAILRRNAKCLVYDIDDALFRRDTFHAKESAKPQPLVSLPRHCAGGRRRPGGKRLSDPIRLGLRGSQPGTLRANVRRTLLVSLGQPSPHRFLGSPRPGSASDACFRRSTPWRNT